MAPLKVPLNDYCVLSDILITIHNSFKIRNGTKFSVLEATLLITMKLRTVKIKRTPVVICH